MLEETLSTFLLDIESTMMPMALLVAFVEVTLYKGASVKSRLVGGILTALTSYMGLYTVEFFLSALTQAAFAHYGYENLVYIVCLYVENIVLTFIFSILFAKTFHYRNNHSPKSPIRASFGAYIYAEYMVVIYTAMLFADNVGQVHVLILALTLIWFLTFRKVFPVIAKIYPRDLKSVENICLIFQVLTVIMLWYLPRTFGMTEEAGQMLFYNWLKLLSILVFVFSLTVHKIVFLQSLNKYTADEALKHDNKTGLLSREYFMEMAQDLIDHQPEDKRRYKVCYVNISRFRFLNRNYGQSKGDQVLMLLARKILEKLPEDALAARMSSDHFVIFLSREFNIETVLLEIRNEIIEETKIPGLQLKLGVFPIPPKAMDAQDAIDSAMTACDKAAGNSTVSEYVFDEKLDEENKNDAYIIANLDRAITNGMIKVYYQPIINLKEKNICSAEALARWDDDVVGFMQPSKFIPLLEKENLIYKVDCYVAEQICKDQRELLDKNMDVYPVGFNISRKDFFVTDMVEYVESMVAKYKVPKNLIKIEITESALTDDEGFINEQIQRFRDRGYKVWMDDFGSGYSSLNSLGNLHFTGIKLDMVFLRELTPEKIKIIKGIVETAKTMGLEILCEGVETSEQIDLLNEVGCENAQGFKFSSPLSLENHMRIAATGLYAPGKWNFNE